MFDIIALGTVTEDVFVTVNRAKIIALEDTDGKEEYLSLVYGAKVPVDGVSFSTGGGAGNSAVTFARMGLRTAAICKVGCDSVAQRIIADLQPEGVDTSLFVWSGAHKTGFSVIIETFAADRTILVHRGAATTLTADELPWEAIAAAPWLYLGSMAGEAAQLWEPVAGFCAERGVHLAINPGHVQRAAGLAGLATVYANTTAVFVNEEEARQITGVSQERGPDDEERMLRMLHDAGCRNVVITDGPQGAHGYDGRRIVHIPSYPVKAVSTVGAGDAFAAGCIVGLHRGMALPEAMRIGAANAAHVVQSHGAKSGIIGWEEALAYIAAREAAQAQERDAAS